MSIELFSAEDANKFYKSLDLCDGNVISNLRYFFVKYCTSNTSRILEIKYNIHVSDVSLPV